jgi:hypothetical protein
MPLAGLKPAVPVSQHYNTKAMPQIWWLVTGFPPHKPELATRAVHVGFLVDKRIGTGFYQSPSVFPSQYHSTTASCSLMYHMREGQ